MIEGWRRAELLDALRDAYAAAVDHIEELTPDDLDHLHGLADDLRVDVEEEWTRRDD